MPDARARTEAAALEDAASCLAAAPEEAERRARAVLLRSPRDPRAILILASARRRRGSCAEALALLEPLARAYPQAARTQYELGLAHLGVGEVGEAEAALRRGLALNRDMPEAWRALGDLLFRSGDAAEAERAYAQHRRAAVEDPRLKPAAEAIFRDDLAAAERDLQARLRDDPRDGGALQMLAEIAGRQGRHGDAEVLLRHAMETGCQGPGVRFSCARALFKQQKAAEAIPLVEDLVGAAPKEPAYLNLLAACLSLVGEYGRAISIYKALLDEYPRQAQIWLNYGHALRTVGRLDESVTAYKRCIALAPSLGDAYWSLANLKVAGFTGNDVTAMRDLLAGDGLGEEDRLHLNFALGKALEDAGDYCRSFEHYAAGARLRGQLAPYDPASTHDHLRRTQAAIGPDLIRRQAGSGHPSAEPIFVLGLPRSGSTLVEQILASHPAVEGTMELSEIGLLAKTLGWTERSGRYPATLSALSSTDLTRLGGDYLTATRIHRKLHRERFVDKMPSNFQHLGLIHLILPNARIIDVRRHPLGACFSIFKQHFAEGHPYSYDLDHLGRYYRDYVDMMAHMDALLPGRVHRVIYEDLVNETEAEVRRLLAYCRLPFDPMCLRFYENSRAVMTVSSEQVRRPIFRDGLDRWRNYEPWLDPLKAALGPALEHWR